MLQLRKILLYLVSQCFGGFFAHHVGSSLSTNTHELLPKTVNNILKKKLCTAVSEWTTCIYGIELHSAAVSNFFFFKNLRCCFHINCPLSVSDFSKNQKLKPPPQKSMYQKINTIGVIKLYEPLKDKLWGEKSASLIKICQHEPHSHSPVYSS